MKKESKSDVNALEVLREEFRAMALCHGVEACDEAAAALLDRLALRLGGAHVYIPQGRAINRARVAEEMRRRFDGTNVNSLAREYGLSSRHARRILMSKGDAP